MTALWNFLAMLRARSGTPGADITQFFGSDSSNEEDEPRELLFLKILFLLSCPPYTLLHFLEDEATAAEMREVELSDQTRERGMHHIAIIIYLYVYFFL